MKAIYFLLLLFSLLIASTFTFAECGNGVIDSGEQCDTTNFGGLTCENLDKGYLSGDLNCTNECTIDLSNCITIKITDKDQNKVIGELPQTNASTGNNSGQIIPPENAFCGDGRAQQGEECDKNDFAGKICESFGYTKGELSCTANCIYDVSECLGIPVATTKPNDKQKNQASPEELINDEHFPASNLFGASTITNANTPQILAVACGLWAILMSSAALRITNKRKQNEKKETEGEIQIIPKI